MDIDQALQSAKRSDTIRICLAASGGGHLRQILDLEPAWSKHSYFFVTEDTALGRSLAEHHPTTFLPHMAVGQIRMQSLWQFLASLFNNILMSAKVVRRYKPDVVISTGAGAAFFVVLFSRFFGAETFVIESFARFRGPSLFFRAAARLAHVKIVQSANLVRHFPDALVFDPLVISDDPPPPKKPLIFATVGATLPFDRLTKIVAAAKATGQLEEEIILQVGEGGYKPAGLQAFDTLPFSTVKEILGGASIVICHGGTGSIITALQNGCYVVAVPRQANRGEHYDDHQLEITETFRARGLIDVANTSEELVAAVKGFRDRQRVVATTDHTPLSSFLKDRLSKLQGAKGHAV